MKKRHVICGMVMGLMMAFAVTAAAATFTTDDGVISIVTPDAEDGSSAWLQTVDPNYWFTISDGKSTITIDHLSNGENLPQVQIAGENGNYEGVFQMFLSTKDEVFVIKAMTPARDDLAKMIDIVSTVKVLKYGTKTAIENDTAAEVSEFGIRAINATYYVTADELNVRSTCSTDSNILGVLKRGDEVTVKGAVQRNGADYGWYQIAYGGREAYVSAGFLSDKKPTEEKPAPSNEKYAVSNGFTVYDIYGSNQGKLVKYSDGYYYSNDMQPYQDKGNGSYYGLNTGDTLYNYNPNPSGGDTSPGSQPGAFPVWDAKGGSQGYLVPHTDDAYYYSNDMQPYRNNGDGSYYGINTGDTLYSYNPAASSSSGTQTGTAGSNYYGTVHTHVLSEVTTGTEVYVSADSDDSYVWTDGNGTQYQNNGDGTFTDYYGNHFNLVY